MNIAVSDKTYVEKSEGTNSFALFEDRNLLVTVGPYTILHDCLSMLDIYQQLFEVEKCLRKTSVRSTYQMLMKERDKLKAVIQSRIDAAN